MISISIDFVLGILAIVGFLITEREENNELSGMVFMVQIFVVLLCRLYLFFTGTA